MGELFDEIESDNRDDDITVAAIWLVKRCTLDVASLDRDEGKSDKSPLFLLCRVASTTMQQTCCQLVTDLLYGP